MKIRAKILSTMLVLSAFCVAELATAKTLIEMDGGKPTASLAKSWKKVKDGEYEFELDLTKDVKEGAKVTAAAVKDSLENKLTEIGVKVTAKGASTVSVAYTGDEQKFLEQVSKTKIHGGGTDLAVDSSVSEGGIRAKPIDRPVKEGEVKAQATKIVKGMLTATVNDSKNAKVKANSQIKVKGDVKDLKKLECCFYFVPEKQDGDVWVPKAGSLATK